MCSTSSACLFENKVLNQNITRGHLQIYSGTCFCCLQWMIWGWQVCYFSELNSRPTDVSASPFPPPSGGRCKSRQPRHQLRLPHLPHRRGTRQMIWGQKHSTSKLFSMFHLFAKTLATEKNKLSAPKLVHLEDFYKKMFVNCEAIFEKISDYFYLDKDILLSPSWMDFGGEGCLAPRLLLLSGRLSGFWSSSLLRLPGRLRLWGWITPPYGSGGVGNWSLTLPSAVRLTYTCFCSWDNYLPVRYFTSHSL